MSGHGTFCTSVPYSVGTAPLVRCRPLAERARSEEGHAAMDPITVSVLILIAAAGELLARLVVLLVVACRRADAAADRRDRP